MEIITGVSNWNLVIRREGEGVTILHAQTCDKKAVLPEELFGLPVIALGPRALASGRAAPVGEEVRVTCGGEDKDADWNNAKLEALTLPPALRRIGDYAFLNCFKLRRLEFWDDIAFWGGSALMNCREVDTFILHRTGAAQGESLAYIADELSRELDVTIHLHGGGMARIIFPEYIELFEENVPNHHFDYTIYGAGYPYHRCFQKKKLELLNYDLLWPKFLKVEHKDATALAMAYYRLRFPAELTDQWREEYRAYLAAHAAEALAWRITARDGEGLAFLLRTILPEKEALSAACDLARRLEMAEAVALLLEEQHKRFPAVRRRSFDL